MVPSQTPPAATAPILVRLNSEHTSARSSTSRDLKPNKRMIIMNKQTLRVAKMTLSVLVAVMTVAGSRPLTAQTTSATSSQSDEQVLRDLVRQENEGKDIIKFTESSVFVS